MSIKCPRCSDSSDLLKSILHLHVHCIKAHANEFHTCPWCTIPFGTIRALKIHSKDCSAFDKNQVKMIENELKKVFKYKFTLFSFYILQPQEGEIDSVLVNGESEGKFASNEAAIMHYKEQHLCFTYICCECQQFFQRKSILDDHHAACHAQPSEKAEPSMSTSIAIAMQKLKRAIVIVRKENYAEAALVPAPAAAPMKRKIISKNGSFQDKRRFMENFNNKFCVDCEISFPDMPAIQNHFKIEHKMDVFICSCNHGYLSEITMEVHRKQKQCAKNGAENAAENATKSGSKMIRKNVKIRANALLTEKRIFMEMFNENRCAECNTGFAKRQEIAEHFKRDHSVTVELCETCNKGYMSESALKKHREAAHKLKRGGKNRIKAVSIFSIFLRSSANGESK